VFKEIRIILVFELWCLRTKCVFNGLLNKKKVKASLINIDIN
jgi:hypothetical protein